ncbi:MAG: hypothetical protein ABIB71_08485 [Candidatus Woesearchaeota archaeon]
MGELIYREKYFLLLNQLLVEYNFVIDTPSFNCFDLISDLRYVEQRIGSMDCLIFSNCVDECCPNFLTIDKGFSPTLGKNFDIKIINPGAS